MYNKLLILLPIFYCTRCESTTKIWIPNTNYNNKHNWINNDLPCESSVVEFPEDLDTIVYLPSEIEVGEIVLPNNGELQFSTNGRLALKGNAKSKSCTNKVAQFRNMQRESWFKPDNWKIKQKTNSKAKPHVEHVPCVYDDVIFPAESSFWVQYPELPVSVNSFNMGNENLTNDQLQTYLQTMSGYREFRNIDFQTRTDIININPTECTDISGCECHSDDVSDFVCMYTDACEIPHCLNPVSPVGHCCSVCGAYLLLEYDDHFNILLLEEEVKRHLYISKSSVTSFVSKVLYNDKHYIQVIFMDENEYNGESVVAATSFNKKIISKSNSHVRSSKTFLSGEKYWPGTQTRNTLSIMFGTMIGVVVFLVIICLVYGPTQEKIVPFKFPFGLPNANTFRPFLFARFENDGDGELEFQERSVASSLYNMDRAFDNPLYGKPSTSRMDEDVQEKFNISHSSPSYSELQKQEALESEE